MGIVDIVRSVLGVGGEQTGGEGSQDPLPELTLAIKVPKEDNAIRESFESFEVRLDSLTLETTYGEKVDGRDAVYQLRPEPATYETGAVWLDVMDYELREGEPDLPFEGFENATVDFGGEQFEPANGEESTITLVVTVRKDEERGVYRLDPALEW